MRDIMYQTFNITFSKPNAPQPVNFKVDDTIHSEVFTKSFCKKLFLDPTCGQCKASFYSWLVPVDVKHGLKEFSKDLFFPMFFSEVLRVNEFATKVILGMLFATLDLVTLPIRILTAIPWVLYQMSTDTRSEIYKELDRLEAPRELLKANYLSIKDHLLRI